VAGPVDAERNGAPEDDHVKLTCGLSVSWCPFIDPSVLKWRRGCDPRPTESGRPSGTAAPGDSARRKVRVNKSATTRYNMIKFATAATAA
jgi:hypothetical protein